MKCRHCGTPLSHTFLDLGFAPPSNAYLSADELAQPEKVYPLKIRVCDHCWLAQTEDYAHVDDLFSADYAYFSSTSTSWRMHAANFVANSIKRLQLNSNSFVIEVASNDGYLLKNFVAESIPCLGIEPTASTAAAADLSRIPVIREFFTAKLGQHLASSGQQADLIIGNNVYAHVPDINDFTHGLKTALKLGGTITLEFPHLMRLLEQTQFDTVYHEHFSYLSLYTVGRIFKDAGLRVFDVEELSTHGGSLRIFGCHADDVRQVAPSVNALLVKEALSGVQTLGNFQEFQVRADQVKNDLLSFLIEQKRAGKKVAAYGAAAKGNTLLNYAGVRPDLISFVCDAAPSKQGKFMPGSHIPILTPQAMQEHRPDFVVILPWNLADEIIKANAFVLEWGAQFVTAIPELRIIR